MLWGALFQNLLSKILLSIYKAQLSLSEISSSSAVRSPSSKLLKITYIIMGEFEMIDNLKCQKLPLRILNIISALLKKIGMSVFRVYGRQKAITETDVHSMVYSHRSAFDHQFHTKTAIFYLGQTYA